MITELNCKKINKTVKNPTAKPRNVSLQIYQERPDILPVYIKEGLTLLMFLPSVTTRPLKCNDSLINGLFHSRCLDFHTNEKIIIFKLALSEKGVYKLKTRQTSFENTVCF